MAEIRWTFEALRCLEGIHEYIAADNPRAASDVVRGIYAKVQLLCEHPRLGQRYEVGQHEQRDIFHGAALADAGSSRRNPPSRTTPSFASTAASTGSGPVWPSRPRISFRSHQ